MDYHGQAQFQFRRQQANSYDIKQANSYDINSPLFSAHLLTLNPSHTLKTYF